MKPLDDMLPEEREPQHAELIALLLSHQPAPLTENAQAEAIARVRAQLLNTQTPQEGGMDEDREHVVVNIPAQTPHLSAAGARRSGRIVRFVNTLAAVLIIGAIISVSILLFTHRSTTVQTAITASPISSPTTISSQANGLEASMSLTPGPYFLGELLVANLKLSNHSQTTYPLLGKGTNPCDPALSVTPQGGGEPHVSPPVTGFKSCPALVSYLAPDQTITVPQYLLLTDSGHITLTMTVKFMTGTSPLDGRWPSLRINVHPQVPADRLISFQLEGTRAIVHAPAGAQSHLLYTYVVNCQDFHDAGGTETGNYAWEHISSNTVGLPGCPGKNLHWQFAFAAVGYAYVSGHYPA